MWLGGHFSLDFDYNLYCYSVGGFKMLKLEIARCSHFHVENEVWIFCGIILVFFCWVFFFFSPLVTDLCVCSGESELSQQRWMFEQQALQEYILLCCQNPTGGLLDKPGKSVPHHLSTHTHYIFVQLYSCVAFLHHCPVLLSWYVQVQRFLPHVLLPQRPLHSTALWEHGQPLRGDPRQGGE